MPGPKGLKIHASMLAVNNNSLMTNDLIYDQMKYFLQYLDICLDLNSSIKITYILVDFVVFPCES